MAAEAPRGRRAPSPRPVWPHSLGAMHRLIPRDPSASVGAQLEVLFKQLAANREQMAVLRDAIERLHGA